MSDRSSTGGYDPSGIDLDAWTKLEQQLEQSIPHYDKVNHWMTFGQDKVWRKNVRNHAEKGMKILEVGCGPGSFAEDLVGLDVTCLDPSAEMLRVAKKRVDSARASRGEGPAKYVEAIAESIPLPDDTFDRVFCLFSFRDFQDKKKGLEEIFRVLKPGGQVVICDAGKANWFHGLAGRIWMATVVQIIARIITKEKDHPWKGLARTYSHYGTNGYYRKVMRDVGFEDVQGRLLLPFGMSSRFRGFKPKR
ncbi:MAG: methyltransferase domain-containing protein [Candidatus Poseidoniales archaeon]|nr:MAG: methyltransferase domain-containing protein [Candidatus Poseidoniales archaeon]